jgi:hypothetical protein
MRILRTVLVVVALLAAGAWLQAQATKPTGLVITGNDIGFQVEGRSGDTVTGKFVVRIDGRWVEPAGGRRLIGH